MIILHALRTTGSTLAKEDLLRHASENDKKIFKLAYDPDKMFYQKFSEIEWATVSEPDDSMFILLEMLTRRRITGAQARSMVQDHAETYGDLIKLICNKDLDVGVSATTLNKVFGRGFVPKFLVQLAKEEDIKNVSLPITGQIKYNGTRVIAIVEPGDSVLFKTRNGHSFKFPSLEKVILDTILYPTVSEYGCIYDGELCFGDSQGENHARVSGIVNSAIKGTPIPDHLGLVFNTFDFMSKPEFDAAECHKTYRERYTNLHNSFLPSKFMKVAETLEFTTTEQIQAKFSEVLANRYEGLILKSWDHKYTFKRSKDWIKLKAIKDATLEVLNIIPGEGKYEGMIGALQCDGTVEGKHVIVNVGSGLNDADRSMDPSHFVGAKIDVKYNEVIANKNDNTFSLFLPRFITVRGDLA